MTILLPIAGGCQCGSLRYQVSRPPRMIHVCHCRDCQVRTGSAFSMAMPVRTDGFALIAGDTATSERVSPVGHRSVHYHCRRCLVRTHTISDARPDLVTVRPGTLDDTSWMAPAVQLWTRSAMSWAVADSIPCLIEGAADYAAYRDPWRATHIFVRSTD